MTAAHLSGKDLFFGSYPITPASDILHELSKYKNFGVRTFQAEDEIAAICAAIGAAFGGALAVTTSSGPGIALNGPSHQDGAIGPFSGRVRPPWRMPDARDRGP